MRNIILFTISLFITVSVNAQEFASETRTVGAFDKISITSIIKVELVKGDANEIEIYTENVPLKYIKSQVKNGELILDLESRKKGWNDVEINVKVPYKNIRSISGNVASTISSDEILKKDVLHISLNEASQCQLKIECDALAVNLNSASKLQVEGTCRKLDAHVNSAASLKAFSLAVTDAEIMANSMANVKINVSNNLDVTANSMAKVSYMGAPSKIDKNISSMASIKKVDGDLKPMK